MQQKAFTAGIVGAVQVTTRVPHGHRRRLADTPYLRLPCCLLHAQADFVTFWVESSSVEDVVCVAAALWCAAPVTVSAPPSADEPSAGLPAGTSGPQTSGELVQPSLTPAAERSSASTGTSEADGLSESHAAQTRMDYISLASAARALTTALRSRPNRNASRRGAEPPAGPAGAVAPKPSTAGAHDALVASAQQAIAAGLDRDRDTAFSPASMKSFKGTLAPPQQAGKAAELVLGGQV